MAYRFTWQEKSIEQIDGNFSVARIEVDDNEKYIETNHNWKTGRLGTVFQTFIEEKEKAKIVEA